MEFNHKSVMLYECIDALDIKEDGIYVDGTAGGAGHSTEIAKRLGENGRLFSFDKDPDAVKICRERLAPYKCAEVIHSDFADMEAQLKLRGIEKLTAFCSIWEYRRSSLIQRTEDFLISMMHRSI